MIKNGGRIHQNRGFWLRKVPKDGLTKAVRIAFKVTFIVCTREKIVISEPKNDVRAGKTTVKSKRFPCSYSIGTYMVE